MGTEHPECNMKIASIWEERERGNRKGVKRKWEVIKNNLMCTKILFRTRW